MSESLGMVVTMEWDPTQNSGSGAGGALQELPGDTDEVPSSSDFQP